MQEKLFDFERMTVKEIGDICRTIAYCEDCPFGILNEELIDCAFQQIDVLPRDWRDQPIEPNLRAFFGE